MTRRVRAMVAGAAARIEPACAPGATALTQRARGAGEAALTPRARGAGEAALTPRARGAGETALTPRARGAGEAALYEQPAGTASRARPPGRPAEHEGRVPRGRTVLYAYPFDLEMRLRQALIAGDEDGARRALDGLVDHLRRQSAGLQRLKSDAIHLAVVLVRKCLQAGLGVEEILADAAAWAASILAAPGADAVTAELEAVAGRLLEACRSQRMPSRRRSAELARSYIDAHFQQDLTLHEVARVVNLSYSYLSRVFARETGTTFQDYLASARVTAAKDLLRGTDLRIEEISGLVGYDDPSHFIRVFKARVGVTPGRFQRCAAG